MLPSLEEDAEPVIELESEEITTLAAHDGPSLSMSSMTVNSEDDRDEITSITGGGV